jgi:hypothetical protein
LELNTIIVVDRCAMLWTSSKAVLCTWQKYDPSSWIEEHVLEWFENHWIKDKFEEQVLDKLRIIEQKFILQVLSRTKDIFLKKVILATSASLPGLQICKLKA